MDSEPQLSLAYQGHMRNFKKLTMFGQLTILILRILAQRIFSVYIGIVLVQFIITTQMNFRTYCTVESKFYILMNFSLIYLLIINFIEKQTSTKSNSIQMVLKDKYIIDYVKIGYPVEFLFRVVSTLLMWRVYQYGRMKTAEYGEAVPVDQVEVNSQRYDRIHVRENVDHGAFGWGGGSSNHNDVDNSRNINLNSSSVFSRSVANSPPQLVRLRSSRTQQSNNQEELMNPHVNQLPNFLGLQPVPYQSSGVPNNVYPAYNRQNVVQNRAINNPVRIVQPQNQPHVQWAMSPCLGPNLNPYRYQMNNFNSPNNGPNNFIQHQQINQQHQPLNNGLSGNLH